jgi:hypothetical protein
VKHARSREPEQRVRSIVPLAAALCALGIGALGMTAVRTAFDRESKQLRQLRGQVRQASLEIDRLGIEVEELLAPAHLELEARKLGMRYPLPEQKIGAVASGEPR